MRRKLMTPMVAITMSFASSYAAAEVTRNERIVLQATMQQSIARNLINGRYFYFDVRKSEVNAIYPAKTHPMILEMGDHFILCTDFRNGDGDAVNVDFYVTRKDDTFVVFDTVVENRTPIERMMKAGLVKMVK